MQSKPRQKINREVNALKFKLTKGKGSVNRFVNANDVVHKPGDVIDLPQSFKGEKWLEPINKTVLKPMVPVEEKEVLRPEVDPLPEKEAKTSKRLKKKKS